MENDTEKLHISIIIKYVCYRNPQPPQFLGFIMIDQFRNEFSIIGRIVEGNERSNIDYEVDERMECELRDYGLKC